MKSDLELTRAAFRATAARYEKVLGAHGLSVDEFEVLVAFARRSGCIPISEIARDLGEPRSTIARVVAALATRELLESHWLSIRRIYYVPSSRARALLYGVLGALATSRVAG